MCHRCYHITGRKEKMNELALFAGAGGGLLGSRLLGWRPVCAVEHDEYRRNVLIQRQRDHIFSPFPIWDDVKTFDGRPWYRRVDVVSAGFPCQPYSGAGQQRGEDDSRNLWPDTIRIINEVHPRFCLLENVPELLSFDYFGTILKDLAQGGYFVRYRIISAYDIGANHLRERLWIVAESQSCGCGGRCSEQRGMQGGKLESCKCKGGEIRGETKGCCSTTSDTKCKGLQGFSESDKVKTRWKVTNRPASETDVCGGLWWESEPGVGRMGDGDAHWMDRIKALGDAQVPGVVRAAWMLLGGE